MPAPTNTTPATAINISALPYATTQTLTDSGTDYTVWYKYTPADDETISVWGYGVIGSHQANTSIWTLDGGGSPVGYLSLTDSSQGNTPLTFPVEAGTTYYFKFIPVLFSVATFVLTLAVDSAPAEVLPDAFIFVNDDTQPFQAIALDATDGTLLRYIEAVSGEEGDVLVPGGQILLEDNAATSSTFQLYTRSFEPIAAVAALTGGVGLIRTTPSRDRFYIANSGIDGASNPVGGATVAKYTTVSSSGATGTVVDFPDLGLSAIAPDLNETVLYYARRIPFTGVWDRVVKRIDLTTGLPLSDLVTVGAANDRIHAMLVTADDDLIVAFFEFATSQNFIQRFNAAGVLQATYSFGTVVGGLIPTTVTRLAYDFDDEGAFWVWEHGDDGFSHFRKIRLSDGTQLTHLQVAQYEGGYYSPDENADPARFGVSESCPFLVLSGTAVDASSPCPDCGPTTGGSGGGTSPGGHSGDPPETHPGPLLPPVDVEAWDVLCAGGGIVPTAPDLTDAENWDD